MNIHSINTQGKFKNKKLTTLPTWTANDEGREIYDSTTGKKYYGSNIEWVDYIDGKVLVSSTDSVREYLEDKIIAGDNIEINTIVSDVDANSRQLQINSTYNALSDVKYLIRYNNTFQQDNNRIASFVTFNGFTKSVGYTTSSLDPIYTTLFANNLYILSYNIQMRNRLIVGSAGRESRAISYIELSSGVDTWKIRNVSESRNGSNITDYFSLTGKSIIKPTSNVLVGLKVYTEDCEVSKVSFTIQCS